MKLLPAILILLCTGLSYAQDTIPDITLAGHQYTVYCIDISEDNKYLVSGGWDNTVKIWDYKNAKEIQSYDYHKDMIRELCFSPDNSMIASASRDNTIKVTTLSNGDVRTITNEYEPNIEDYFRDSYFNSLTFTPDIKQIVFTLAGRNDIFFWDIESNSLSDKIIGPESGMKEIEISHNGNFIAGISGENSIIIWDQNTKKQVSTLRGHAGSAGTLCFSKDDKYLVSGGGMNVSGRKPMEHYNLLIWDVARAELKSVLSGHVDVVKKVKFTPDGKYIASASEDNSVRLWDVHTSKQVWKYESDCYFLSCAISPDGKYLAASSRDETIKIWGLKKIINNSQSVSIPDKAFVNALIEEGVDTNGDRIISYVEAALITYLDISGNWDEGEPGEVENMKGIEAFINMDTLRCNYMQLSSLDLSDNTALKYLHCNENQLSSLDVSGCIALTELECERNLLSTLDLSNNPYLLKLKCRLNQLSSLNISACKALTRLDCDNNQLSSLDLSNHTSLTNLQCWENQLTRLDISACIAITKLDCDYNLLSSLDISNNNALKKIGLRHNPNLQKVFVWTMPFPPEGVILSTDGSPMVSFTSLGNANIL